MRKRREPEDSVDRDPDELAAGWVSLAFRLLLPVVLLGAGGLAYHFFSRETPPPDLPPPAPTELEVQVSRLERQSYQIRVNSQGAIRAHSEVNLTAQVTGRVQRMHPSFEDGAFFAAGEILLELDPADFELALAAAKAQLSQATLNLQQEEARQKQSLLDWIDLGYDEEPSDLVRRVPQMQFARDQVELAEAQLLSAQLSLERSKIRAPFDGRVLSRSVGVGQTIGGSTPLGVIFATDYSEVRLPVSTRFLKDLSLPEDITDSPLEVVLRDGLDSASEMEWDAKILRTEGALDERTLELFAVARIDDPFGLKTKKIPLRVGQPVATEIPGRILEDVFVVPRETVNGLNRLRVVDPDTLTLGTVVITPVWADESHLVFRDQELAEGTLLITTQLMYAPDGGKVVIVEDDLTAGPGEPFANSGKAEDGDGGEKTQ